MQALPVYNKHMPKKPTLFEVYEVDPDWNQKGDVLCSNVCGDIAATKMFALYEQSLRAGVEKSFVTYDATNKEHYQFALSADMAARYGLHQ